MKIELFDFVEGASKARGIVVIIDVFRAFSTACYAFANGAASIIAVGEVNKALELKSYHSDWVLIGERGGKKLEGFDYGNSPTEIKDVDFQGKTLILTTHSGTQGLVNATSSEKLMTGSFVNAKATARHIISMVPSEVNLVRMGLEASRKTDEDDLCAEYLRSLLLDIPFDVNTIKPVLRRSPCSERFFDKNKPWSPSNDFDLCLSVDQFDFVITAKAIGDGLVSLEQCR